MPYTKKFKQKYLGKIDWIVTYPPFGIEISRCLARLFECKLANITSLDQPALSCDIKPSDAVLFCADDFHMGGSYRKVKEAVSKLGAQLSDPLVVIVNFFSESQFDGHEIVALIDKRIQVWEAHNCPFCALGSIPLNARERWEELVCR